MTSKALGSLPAVASVDTGVLLYTEVDGNSRRVPVGGLPFLTTSQADAAYQPLDSGLTDIAGLTPTANKFIVGDAGGWASDTGSAVRRRLALDTGDAPQFAGVNLGHASDTTLARSAAGRATIEGNEIFSAFPNQFAGLTEKSSPVAGDFLVLEDSEDTGTPGAKKKVQVGNVVGGGLVLLASGTVSDAATLDIVLTSFTEYRGFKFVLSSFVPASGVSVQFLMRTSTDSGSSYDAGASDYSHGGTFLIANNTTTGTTGSESDNADSEIVLDGSVTSGQNVDLVIDAFGLSNATRGKFLVSAVKDADTGGLLIQSSRSGMRLSSADVDAVRFLFSSGNIASGNWAVYGYA